MNFVLTPKQAAFVKAYSENPVGSHAAIAAGYSPATAATAASRLLKHPSVAAELMRRRVKPSTTTPAPLKQRAETPPAVAAELSPLDYLLSVMRDPSEDQRLRLEAAKVSLPFMHTKPGALGKKDAASQLARTTAATSKFRTQQPPPRLVVDNRGPRKP